MKIKSFLIGVIFGMEMCYAETGDIIKDIIIHYQGEPLNTLNGELLRENRQRLYSFSGLCEYHEEASLLWAYAEARDLIILKNPNKEEFLEKVYGTLSCRKACRKYKNRWEEVHTILLNKVAEVFEISFATVKEIVKDDLGGPDQWDWNWGDASEGFFEHTADIYRQLLEAQEK